MAAQHPRSVSSAGPLAASLASLLLLVGALTPAASASPWPWRPANKPVARTIASLPPPAGARRSALPASSFAAWLRGLPLRAAGTPVRLFNGRKKANQGVHHAVVDIDLLGRNLQQCADAVLRLRAEYLWASGQHGEIGFHLTNRMWVPWSRWSAGARVKVVGGRKTTWVPGSRGRHHKALQRYLRFVMTYAGTASMAREMRHAKVADLAPGDLLIQGGHPGHAVLVLDLAARPDGRRYILLGQSYMPAQDFHVLRNHRDPSLSPWFPVAALARGLDTPQWPGFTAAHIRTWRGGLKPRRR